MRYYLRKAVIATISLFTAAAIIPTLKFGPDYKNVIIAIAAILVASIFIKPLFSLILIPINLFTHISVSLLLNIAVIFALVFLLPGFSISAFDFKGANIEGFIIPEYSFNQTTAIILVAIVVTLVQKTLHYIFE